MVARKVAWRVAGTLERICGICEHGDRTPWTMKSYRRAEQVQSSHQDKHHPGRAVALCKAHAVVQRWLRVDPHTWGQERGSGHSFGKSDDIADDETNDSGDGD